MNTELTIPLSASPPAPSVPGYGFTVGQIVRFHPIIGGRHDNRKYQVRELGELCGRKVAWLHGKPGCVAIEALSIPAPGFGFVDPLAP